MRVGGTVRSRVGAGKGSGNRGRGQVNEPIVDQIMNESDFYRQGMPSGESSRLSARATCRGRLIARMLMQASFDRVTIWS
jgi:hypothetical protein